MKFVKIVVLVILIVLTGCSQESKVPEGNVKLKVLAWNERVFNETYGNYFMARYPNYDLDVISLIEYIKAGDDISKVVNDLISTENPDVVVLPMDQYELLRDQNKLIPLNARIKKDGFDLKAISPAITDYLTDDQSQIHGLAPSFIGTALYYNKKLFDANGIPYPADHMTWDEVFNLTERFPKTADNGMKQYGLYHRKSGNPFFMALDIGEGSGLTIYNQTKFTLNTKAWADVFSNVGNCFKTEACYTPNSGNDTSTNRDEVEMRSYPFLGGNVAMSIDESSLYQTLKMNTDRYSGLDWGVVSLPESTDQPGTGNGITINNIFSIPVESKQANAAWDLIKYVCGKEYDRLFSRITGTELPVRTHTDGSDENAQPFYELEHINNNLLRTLRELPKQVIARMDEVSENDMRDIISGKMTVAEALDKIEFELQEAANVQSP